MAIRSKVPTTINSRNNRDLTPTQGFADVVEWTKKERFKNAFRLYIIMVMVNFLGAAMPPFHLIVGTSLFLLTWYLTLDKYNQVYFIEGGTGSCPKCGHEFPLERSKYNQRITDSCSQCHEEVEILIQ